MSAANINSSTVLSKMEDKESIAGSSIELNPYVSTSVLTHRVFPESKEFRQNVPGKKPLGGIHLINQSSKQLSHPKIVEMLPQVTSIFFRSQSENNQFNLHRNSSQISAKHFSQAVDIINKVDSYKSLGKSERLDTENSKEKVVLSKNQTRKLTVREQKNFTKLAPNAADSVKLNVGKGNQKMAMYLN